MFMKMWQNIMHFPSKKNIAKYTPFIKQFWSDQVLLSDIFKLSGPLPTTHFKCTTLSDSPINLINKLSWCCFQDFKKSYHAR